MINSGRGQAADDLARASMMAAAAACKITIWQQGTAPPVPLAERAALLCSQDFVNGCHIFPVSCVK